MAGKKLYKSKITKSDIVKVQRYLSTHAQSFFIEIWQDGSEDGDVYEIHPTSLGHAIHLTDKYYDNVNASKKVAELLVRERNGEYTCIYHTEKNRSGLTYEILKLSEGNIT